jgi:hypothetical protein
MSVSKKIDRLIEENIFRGEKIDSSKLAQAIKRDYENNVLSSLSNSVMGNILTGGWGRPLSGVYQGMRTGHPVVGFFHGKAGTLGAASNNIKGINVGDAFNAANVAGDLGIFAPLTAAGYGMGKLFGSRQEIEDYARRLTDSGIRPQNPAEVEAFLDKQKKTKKGK